MTALSLARKSVGAPGLWLFAVGASAPLTVLLSVVTTYGSTGVVGVPLSFLLLGTGLAVLTVGFVYMASYVRHPALFYGLMAAGIGRATGVAAGAVAWLSYTSIHLSLYGLFGATLGSFLDVGWGWCAAGAWVAVAGLGLVRVDINARVFAWTLVAEIAVVVVFDIAAFARPAGGEVDLAPLGFGALFSNGVGGAFALGIAAFVGYESTSAYSEEARSPRSIIVATFGALGFVTVFYAVSAWALAAATGAARVSAAARADPELPLTILDHHFGVLMLILTTVLLLTSIFAAMLSFHNSATRYVFGMAREAVLPPRLAQVGTGVTGGAPTRASRLQSMVSAAGLGAALLLQVNPLTMFAWLAAVSAVGVLVLLLSTAVASYRFFRDGGGTNEGRWVRVGAPVLGGIAGLSVLGTTVANLDSLLGVDPPSLVPWAVPGTIAATAVLGCLWGVSLRVRRPDAYATIGRGQPDPLTPDDRLADLEV